jgi:hypothetical protein
MEEKKKIVYTENSVMHTKTKKQMRGGEIL